MNTATTSACRCSTIGAEAKIQLCVEHHAYWLGDKRLASVTQVIKSTWPIKPSWDQVDPAVIEHARERGSRVDDYFTEYLNFGVVTIQAGEWTEVLDLLEKLILWWNGYDRSAKSQVILHDDTIAGMCDLVGDGFLYDLKTTYGLEPVYAIQVGAYMDLYQRMTGKDLRDIGIIHLTKRFQRPKLIPLDPQQCLADWRTLRAMWEMVQRKTT